MSTTTKVTNPIDQDTDEREKAAKRYVEQLRAFYAHASVFILGMTIIFLVNLLTNLAAGIAGEWGAWWAAWALLGWSLGLAVHGLVVWLNRPSHSPSTWQQQQINKILER